MIKFIKKLLFWAFILSIIFVTLALTGGGKHIRKFGSAIMNITEDIGETADFINSATKDVKSATRTLKQTGKQIKNAASDTVQKTSGIINATGRVIEEVKGVISDEKEGRQQATKPKRVPDAKNKRAD